MDRHIRNFYRECSDDTPRGHFHSVIDIQKEKDCLWEELFEKCSNLCKGWFELAQLPTRDRIDFTREFWLSKLPFHPGMSLFLDKFFARIDDITPYLVQLSSDGPFEAHLVYSLKKGNGFFRGLSSAQESDIHLLKQQFTGVIFPEEYLAFLQIHNGFCKTTDSGILKANQVKETYLFLQNLIASQESIVKSGQQPIDPLKLIPFYQSFGMAFFQCFYTEWYPQNEMGNVYYSHVTNGISNLREKSSVQNLAFTTFANWLMFYLEELPT